MNVEVVAQIGGIFALLVLVHFVADWVFQSHAEAMAKPKNHWIRAKHCFSYTMLCCAAITPLIWPGWQALTCAAAILFYSHFLEDTYLPVFVWAKFIRKPPEMTSISTAATVNLSGLVLEEVDGKVVTRKPDTKDFVAFASTPLGKILLIAIDQIVHLVFLLPVAVMIVLPKHVLEAGLMGLFFAVVLTIVCWVGLTRKSS